MNKIVTVTKLKSLFEGFDKFQGVPRSELEERIMTLLAFVSRQLADEHQLNENLTHVQNRCTEQELELRQHRAESKLAGTPVGDFLLEAAHMNELALKKYPGPYSLEHMLCVLCEESGEAARAHCHQEGPEALRLELAQTAGVCARIVTECLNQGVKYT
jgi:hypothetical protein